MSDYLTFLLELVDGRRYKSEREIASVRDRVLAEYLGSEAQLHVLDLGCGNLRPQYEILRARGHIVVGVDLANKPSNNWESGAYRLARGIYRFHLGKEFETRNRSDGLVCADAARLPFSTASFDMVTSVAAFEHFLDVSAVVSEMHRVLKPGGVFFAGIHLFTSLSGGHNVQLMGLPITSLPQGVDAWDHLRERRIPFHVPLNKWRADEYVAQFETYFEILEVHCAEREGEKLLTPELERELTKYTRDELTCKALNIFGRKPNETTVGFQVIS